jgi:hypothetical protein
MWFRSISCLLMSAVIGLAQVPALPQTLAGEWQGTLANHGFQMRLLMHVAASADGRMTGTLDSLDQNSIGARLGEFTLDGRAVGFTVPSYRVPARFEGVLDEPGTTLAGTWTQRNALPLTFTRGTTPWVALRRPQEPHTPFPIPL